MTSDSPSTLSLRTLSSAMEAELPNRLLPEPPRKLPPAPAPSALLRPHREPPAPLCAPPWVLCVPPLVAQAEAGRVRLVEVSLPACSSGGESSTDDERCAAPAVACCRRGEGSSEGTSSSSASRSSSAMAASSCASSRVPCPPPFALSPSTAPRTAAAAVAETAAEEEELGGVVVVRPKAEAEALGCRQSSSAAAAGLEAAAAPLGVGGGPELRDSACAAERSMKSGRGKAGAKQPSTQSMSFGGPVGSCGMGLH